MLQKAPEGGSDTDDAIFPELIRIGHRFRAFEDGGGLPSLGKLPSHLRRFPAFVSHLVRALDEATVTHGIGKTLFENRHGCNDCPIPQDVVLATRRLVASAVAMHVGPFSSEHHSQAGGPAANFCLGLWEGILSGLQDPDLLQMDFLWNGCDAGYDAPIPRSHLFRASKDVPNVDTPLRTSTLGGNYQSVKMHEERAWEKLQKRIAKGWIQGPYELQQLQHTFGEKVCVGKLAAILEDDATGKLRIVHDGTVGGSGPNISISVEDATANPSIADVRSCIAPGSCFSALKLDVESAHHLLYTKVKDQGLQCFQWTGAQHGKQGFYYWSANAQGMKHTPYYWERVGAALLRCIVGLITVGHHPSWAFRYMYGSYGNYCDLEGTRGSVRPYFHLE